MRIVIFGPGRVGASVAAFAASLGHETALLSRADGARAGAEVARADRVAAAIPDDALNDWHAEWRGRLGGKRAFHFSGARVIEGLPGYHPLYSFPTAPLDPAQFGKIAIAREPDAAPFAEIIPGANNPEFAVAAEDRAFYHALAVVSGNFAAHIWNETATAFAERLGANSGEILSAYLGSVVDRFRESPAASLTGPVARGDAATVRANLQALERAPRLRALYESFLKSAWPGRAWGDDGG
jgi:2-dehydropantoate 2-reductase